MRCTLMSLGTLIALAGCVPAPVEPHPLVLDHVLSYAQGQESHVVEALTTAGFSVAPESHRFPDGVYGRYVIFEDSYIEILWLEPENTADEGTKAQAAWTKTGASPFGIGFRRAAANDEALPFPSIPQTQDWMLAGTEMRILGDPENRAQPGLFVVPAYMAANSEEVTEWRARNPDEAASLLSHPNNAAGISSVTVTVSGDVQVSPDMRLAETGTFLLAGEPALMTVRLKGEGGKVLDLRPDVPMVVEY